MEPNEFRVTIDEVIGPQLRRLQGFATTMGIVGLIFCAVGVALALIAPLPPGEHPRPPIFFQAYLHGYLFWIGATVGSLGLLALHHTVGGGWGFLVRRFLEAAASPWMVLVLALGFIPIALGLAFHLYEWADPHLVAHDRVLQQKAAYLNVPFFLVRSAAYFIGWGLLAWLLKRWGDTQNERADPEISARLNYTGAAGILFLVLSVTFASVDWVMSLTPHWFSSIFGLIFAASWALTALALVVLLLGRLGAGTELLERLPTRYYRDLGNLLLALVMLWAYLSFSQYLITYSGNTLEEITWYRSHTQNLWVALPLALIVLHFALPFLVLLKGDRIKRDPVKLANVALLIVLVRFVENLWLVAPTFRDRVWLINPADVGAPLLLGGIWLFLWARGLRGEPVLPLHDPRLEAHWHELAAHHV